MASNQAAQNFQALTKKSFDITFHLEGSHYDAVETIGTGAYGVVCSAVHRLTKEKVAIKKIPSIFEQPAIAKLTIREMKILRHFKHDNIIAIREIIRPSDKMDDVYIVLDLMESDLHKIIHSPQALTTEHVRYFLYQLLRGLKYIHSANVIHRDLKPSNLLVNENCELKIGDFGMARGISSKQTENHMITQYVATRWYRAPEIMLIPTAYTAAVDIWSVGCILAEMVGRQQIFPGKDYKHQLQLIFGILGTPSSEFLKMTKSPAVCNWIQGFGFKKREDFMKMYPKASPGIIDLLNKLLLIDPRERMQVEEALAHPFLMNYHNIDDEPICIPVFNFDFEDMKLDQKKLREVVAEEIDSFHHKKSKITFNFRPVPKTELEKSQAKRNAKKLSPVACDENAPKEEKPDVIMLSADSTVKASDVEMSSASQMNPQQQQKTSTGMASMNTKAKILDHLVSKRKMKSDSGAEKEKVRPITALQRQREREEKRRKKKERAEERRKKESTKEPMGVSLTEEDKSLLARWKKLAKPTEPAKVTHSQPGDNSLFNQTSNVPLGITNQKPENTNNNSPRGTSDDAHVNAASMPYDYQFFSNSPSSAFTDLLPLSNDAEVAAPSVSVPAVVIQQPVQPKLQSDDKAFTDNLTIITRQMKNSRFEDLTLAVTPKGTGGGYGVGVDLELSSNPPKSACLSASLLTDWMELTNDMEIPNLEEEDLGSGLDLSELLTFPKQI